MTRRNYNAHRYTSLSPFELGVSSAFFQSFVSVSTSFNSSSCLRIGKTNPSVFVWCFLSSHQRNRLTCISVKFGFINGVDNVKLLESLNVVVNLHLSTQLKFLCTTPQPMQHHSFLRTTPFTGIFVRILKAIPVFLIVNENFLVSWKT